MSLSLKIVVVLRSFSKPGGFVIPLQVDDLKKFCDNSVIFFQFCGSKIYMTRQHPLTEVRGVTEPFLMPNSGSFHRGEHALAWRSQS